MNYTETLKYIENVSRIGSKLGLDNVKLLLEQVGNPQDKLKIIHVAGTNGKGSTCAFIANALTHLGYKTGLYSSPHLEEFGERIRIDNKNISKEDLTKIVTNVKSKIDYLVEQGYDHPTEFEIVTVVAYLYFLEKNVDFVVLEVGLGGLLDATNTCTPIVSVITSISIDHMDVLGNSIEEIARAKGGIIKPNVPVVVYDQGQEIIKELKGIAEGNSSQMYITDNNSFRIISKSVQGQEVSFTGFDGEQIFEISMLGKHQIKNLNTAYTTLKVLEKTGLIKINQENLKRGFKTTKWPGRFEVITAKPLTIIDGAHNEDGAKSLQDAFETYLNKEKITLVIGMLKDKDIEGTLSHIIPYAERLIITVPPSSRAATTEEIKKICQNIERNSDLNLEKIEIQSVEESVSFVQSNAKELDTVVYAGSLYMIGAARTELKKLYSI